MGDCSETTLSSEENRGLYCSFWKCLVIVPLFFPIGSSKSKQSAQFDPAKQAYTGKVQTCHERRNGNVDDIVYPGGELLGKVADFFRICRVFSNSTSYWGAASNHKFTPCVIACSHSGRALSEPHRLFRCFFLLCADHSYAPLRNRHTA